MLDHTKVLERLGRNEEAEENYDCIIADFSWFLDDYDVGEEINDEDIIALESLKVALEKRLNADKSHQTKLNKTVALLSSTATDQD